MKLKKAQKKFLFEKGYVSAKVLDADTEPGWQDYFIKFFDWKLEEQKNSYGFNTLHLVADDGDYWYNIDLNFRNNDYNKLLEAGKKVC